MNSMQSETVSGHGGQNNHANIPLVFLKETSVFGDRKPAKSEWINHVKLYTALSTRINSTHITGLQRVESGAYGEYMLTPLMTK